MKRNFYFRLGLIFVLVFGLSMVGCSTFTPTSASYSLPDLVGVWEGSYTTNQGETGLTLTVSEENGNYRAIFHFYNLPGRNNVKEGSYFMNVTANHSTRKYNLVGYEWIVQPGNYGFMNLEGTVQENFFTGTALGALSGGTFSFRVLRVIR
jgi:hypothetical protein